MDCDDASLLGLFVPFLGALVSSPPTFSGGGLMLALQFLFCLSRGPHSRGGHAFDCLRGKSPCCVLSGASASPAPLAPTQMKLSTFHIFFYPASFFPPLDLAHNYSPFPRRCNSADSFSFPNRFFPLLVSRSNFSPPEKHPF